MPKKTEVDVDGRRLELSNLEKIFYPKVKFTKAQVIDYYARVAPVLLPHLKNRPVSLKRYPDGVTHPYFFEKQAPSHRPKWIETTPVEGGDRRIDYCMINDLPALVWASNLANLELHTFLHCAPKIEIPTMLAFDLDPGEGTDILLCAQVGLWIRDLLEKLGIESFPKTSGSKGLQLYVPLNTPVNYEKTKAFAHALAERLESEHPDQIVSKMQKKLRIGKVFVDWSQNDVHKTTVTVYSLRAKDRPTVSTPVSWEEVETALRQKDQNRLVFVSDDVLGRVEKNGDLFEPVLRLKQKLPSLNALLGKTPSGSRKSGISERSIQARKPSKRLVRTSRSPSPCLERPAQEGLEPDSARATSRPVRQSLRQINLRSDRPAAADPRDSGAKKGLESTSDRKEKKKEAKELAIEIQDDGNWSEPEISALRQLRPMLAKSANAAFNDPEWIFEIKLDGYRALALVDRASAKLISRAGNELSSAYPAIVGDLVTTKLTAVFDGEIVVLDESGVPRFELLQSYRTAHRGHLVYYVFDLLFLNGRDLRNQPLAQRKETLRRVLNGSEIVRYVEHIDGSGKEFFELAKERGLEGIVAKKKSAVYLDGKRVDHWLKIKCRRVEDVIICGFTESRVNLNTLGALLVAVREGAKLKYAGLVGTGLNRAPGLFSRLRNVVTKERPFKTVPKTDMPIRWVEPGLVCSVEYQEWTNDAILRGASFLSLRTDKSASEIE
jgi:bifunctional non-homologous end joining protein LigD